MPAQAMEILRYFLRNPQAADTLEGVTRWRLTEERVHRSVEEVDRALRWLVEEGFLLKGAAQGAAPIFRLNQGNADDASGFVTDEGAKGRHRQRE